MKAVLVDPSKRRKRRDETDVRAFRRLNRTDPTVVGGVNVTNLKARTLTRQTTRSERREAPLVGNLGERVRLVHELRQLRRPEELLDRGDHRLRVDEIVRHRRVDVLMNRHLLLDRTLHPDEADAELVLEELTDGTNTPVAEVCRCRPLGRHGGADGRGIRRRGRSRPPTASSDRPVRLCRA